MKDRVLNGLKWAGSTIQIVGVFGLAGRLIQPSEAFCILLAGSLLWVAAAAIMKEWSVLALNSAFVVTNVLGIYRWADGA